MKAPASADLASALTKTAAAARGAQSASRAAAGAGERFGSALNDAVGATTRRSRPESTHDAGAWAGRPAPAAADDRSGHDRGAAGQATGKTARRTGMSAPADEAAGAGAGASAAAAQPPSLEPGTPQVGTPQAGPAPSAAAQPTAAAPDLSATAMAAAGTSAPVTPAAVAGTALRLPEALARTLGQATSQVAGPTTAGAQATGTETAAAVSPSDSTAPQLTALTQTVAVEAAGRPGAAASDRKPGDTAAGVVATAPAVTGPAAGLSGMVGAPAQIGAAGTAGVAAVATANASAGTSSLAVPAAFGAAVTAAPSVSTAPAPAGAPAATDIAGIQVAASTTVDASTAAAFAGGSAAPAAPFAVPASAAPAPAAPPALPQPALLPQLAKPLFTLAAAAPGQHIMTLKVSPDDLGPLTVRAHIDAAGVRIELFAPAEAGREAVRGLLPELRKELAAAGFGASLNLSDQSGPPTGGHDGAQHNRPDAWLGGGQDPGRSGHGAGGGQDTPGTSRPGHRWDALADEASLRTIRILNGPQTTLDILA